MHPTKHIFGTKFDRGDLSSEASAKEEVLDAEFLVYKGSTPTAGTFVVGGDEAGSNERSPNPLSCLVSVGRFLARGEVVITLQSCP